MPLPLEILAKAIDDKNAETALAYVRLIAAQDSAIQNKELLRLLTLDFENKSLLHFALEKELFAVAQELIDYFIRRDVDIIFTSDNNSQNHFLLCIQKDQPQLLRQLVAAAEHRKEGELGHKFWLNVNVHGVTWLQVAAKQSQEMLSVVLNQIKEEPEAKKYFALKDGSGASALHYAATPENFVILFKAAIEIYQMEIMGDKHMALMPLFSSIDNDGCSLLDIPKYLTDLELKKIYYLLDHTEKQLFLALFREYLLSHTEDLSAIKTYLHLSFYCSLVAFLKATVEFGHSLPELKPYLNRVILPSSNSEENKSELLSIISANEEKLKLLGMRNDIKRLRAVLLNYHFEENTIPKLLLFGLAILLVFGVALLSTMYSVAKLTNLLKYSIDLDADAYVSFTVFTVSISALATLLYKLGGFLLKAITVPTDKYSELLNFCEQIVVNLAAIDAANPGLSAAKFSELIGFDSAADLKEFEDLVKEIEVRLDPSSLLFFLNQIDVFLDKLVTRNNLLGKSFNLFPRPVEVRIPIAEEVLVEEIEPEDGNNEIDRLLP